MSAVVGSDRTVRAVVALCGCDDETRIDLTCTPSEYEFLCWLAERSMEASLYLCMPVLKVERLDGPRA